MVFKKEIVYLYVYVCSHEKKITNYNKDFGSDANENVYDIQVTVCCQASNCNLLIRLYGLLYD